MTTLRLSPRDQAMLDGEHGAGTQAAMRILTRIAKIQGAEELLDISHVHVGGSIYTGPGSLSVIEKLVELGAQVSVPTTLNAISVDQRRWESQAVDPDFAEKAIRLAEGFKQLGASPIFSCTPYVFPSTPHRGDDIVWAESNAIVYANSVIGARTNRHGDFMDICAAITGRAPKAGLHLTENRRGTFLVEVPPLEHLDGSFYTALGYLVGKHAGDLVPVITGIESIPTTEELKALCASVATSGPVGLVHVVGVTPEAPKLEEALGHREPIRTLTVTTDMLLTTAAGLSTGSGTPDLDLIVLGSPHFTLGDFESLAKLTRGRIRHPRVDLIATTSRFVLEQATANGWVEDAQSFGVRFSTDTCLCMLSPTLLPAGTQTVMTSSGKFAHYGPGLIRQNVFYGSLEDCIDSAVAGMPLTSKPAWAAPPSR